MKAIIIDDEQSSRNSLLDKVKRFCPAIEVVAMADSSQGGYEAIKKHAPDLVFLDIAMPMESGFDMLNKFDDINFEIIFITGFDQYAVKAIEFSAIGYLLKPIDVEELIKAVENAQKRHKLKMENKRISNLLENLKISNFSQRKIAIPSGDGLVFVKINNIIRLESSQKYTLIYLTDKTKLLSSYNIGEFRKLLGEYNFYSPHRSHFINKEHIKKYLKEGVIVMSDDSTVPLSKRRRSEFINMMKVI